METPVLNKKQQQKTLASKKSKREVIKNVLGKPYKNYWPLLLPEDNTILEEVLESDLPRIKNKKINIPWSKIKDIPKSERKKFRENYYKTLSENNETIEINKSDSEGLIIGVNNVSKLLENNEAASILIASDVQPRLMVQHITDQAVLHDVPILVVSRLREILYKKCGITSTSIALKKNLKPHSKLVLINQTILSLHENYPFPRDHINYKRKLKLEPLASNSMECNDDVELNKKINSEDNEVINLVDSDSSLIDISSDEEKECPTRSLHLIRKCKEERVFIPDDKSDESNEVIAVEEQQENIMEVDPAQFIPLTFSKPNPINYKALIVKRLKGDKNRVKRKLEKIPPAF